jgi:YebC/PmpR family DNA-binding regulatory protein
MGRAFEYRRKSKEARWDKMSKVFPKLGKVITLAAKEGGADPESNAKLRTAIMNAKAENMPKDNIAAAIKRASGKDSADFSEVNYEGKALHGVMIFIECATDNTTRTVNNIKTYFSKSGGQVVNTGSLEFLFTRRAVIEFGKVEGMDMEEIELELMDHGLEEMEVNGDTVFVFGECKDFGALAKAVTDLGIEVAKASLQRSPTSPVELTEEQVEEIEGLLDKIEDDDDVQAVFTNIA